MLNVVHRLNLRKSVCMIVFFLNGVFFLRGSYFPLSYFVRLATDRRRPAPPGQSDIAPDRGAETFSRWRLNGSEIYYGKPLFSHTIIACLIPNSAIGIWRVVYTTSATQNNILPARKRIIFPPPRHSDPRASCAPVTAGR